MDAKQFLLEKRDILVEKVAEALLDLNYDYIPREVRARFEQVGTATQEVYRERARRVIQVVYGEA